MPTTIFIVMENAAVDVDYNVESVAAVFTTRELADAYAKKHTADSRWSTYSVIAWAMRDDGGHFE